MNKKVFLLSTLLCLNLIFTTSLRAQNTFVVTSIEDNEDIDLADEFCADNLGKCTLRASIQNANKDNRLDKINFNIPGRGPQVIVLRQLLPKIKTPVFLDASTQPNFTYSTPQIIVDGAKLKVKNIFPPPVEERIKGFWLAEGSAGSTIKGFVMGGFGKRDFDRKSGDGINNLGYAIVLDSGNNKIQGNFIGVGADGKTPFPNFWGIANLSNNGNLIGGTKAEDRNIISGNSTGLFTYSGTLIEGNYFGTDVGGECEVGNKTAIELTIFATGVTIQGNVVSGNHTGLILLGENNLVQKNKIGTDAKGRAAIPNETGINMHGDEGDIVGPRNVISGNKIGIKLDDYHQEPQKNRIRANFIGTDLTGSFAVPNEVGISVVKGQSNVIGGENEKDGNLISGNSSAGITVSQTNDLLISSNYVGTTADGFFPLPNDWGIRFEGEPGKRQNTNNVVKKNLISGNRNGGIFLSEASHTSILSNRIGMQMTHHLPLPNGGSGIVVQSSAIASCIGGEENSNANFIAYNIGHGIIFEEKADWLFHNRQGFYNKFFQNCESALYLPVSKNQK